MNQDAYDKTNAWFRKLDDGRTVFYPMGPWGRRGRVVDSPETEARLRTAARRWDIGSAVVCLMLSALLFVVCFRWFGPHWITNNAVAAGIGGGLILLFLIQVSAMHLYFRPIVKGLDRVAIPNTTNAHLGRMGSSWPPFFIRAAKYYMIVCTAVCVVIGVVWFNLFALLMAASCALIAAFYWYADKGRGEIAEERAGNGS